MMNSSKIALLILYEFTMRVFFFLRQDLNNDLRVLLDILILLNTHLTKLIILNDSVFRIVCGRMDLYTSEKCCGCFWTSNRHPNVMY